MSFWKIIKGLNYRQLVSLTGWFLKHPLYMISTIEATLATFRISQQEFPNIHGKHNKANAFRHSLWNILIAKKCARFSSDLETVIDWTKSITDWHEEFSPNEPLAKAMDLHNNVFGRNFYQQNRNLNNAHIVSKLKEELHGSILINSIEEITDVTKMVYLED